jgi:hypothetical protein
MAQTEGQQSSSVPKSVFGWDRIPEKRRAILPLGSV